MLTETERTETETEGTFITLEGAHVRAVVETVADGIAYLERLDVEDGFRGQGLGTAAIREIAAQYDTLYIAADNADAARLYARLGEEADWAKANRLGLGEWLDAADQGFGVVEIE